MSQRQTLIQDTIATLEQGIALLSTIDSASYTRVEAAVAGSSIGGHVRHCIDFVGRFLIGVPEGRIDYDRRDRDADVESDPAVASERLSSMIRALQEHSDPATARPLLVKTDAGLVDEERAPWARSSVDRELQFLLSHTVHHYALIGAILRLSGVEPPAGFGLAPSTLRHQQQLHEERTLQEAATEANAAR